MERVWLRLPTLRSTRPPRISYYFVFFVRTDHRKWRRSFSTFRGNTFYLDSGGLGTTNNNSRLCDKSHFRSVGSARFLNRCVPPVLTSCFPNKIFHTWVYAYRSHCPVFPTPVRKSYFHSSCDRILCRVRSLYAMSVIDTKTLPTPSSEQYVEKAVPSAR